MADKVAVIDSEYDDLKTGLETIHDDYLNQLGDVIGEIRKINDKGGDFYTDLLTPKINNLIDELYTVKLNMKVVFDAHEQLITSFQRVVNDYDS
jgi:hypothetical protein